MTLTHIMERYIHGKDDQFLYSGASSRWGNNSSSDIFVALIYKKDNAWGLHDNDLNELVVKLELDSLRLEAVAKQPTDELPTLGLHDETPIKARLQDQENSSQKAYLTIKPRCSSPMAALSEFCPSLGSDHGGSSNASTEIGTCNLHQPTTTELTGSDLPIPQRDYPIYDHIRHVLSSDPALAEGVISAIETLPPHKRNLLIEDETTDNNEDIHGSSSDRPRSYNGHSKRGRTPDNNPRGGGDGGSPDNSQGVGGGHGDDDGGNKGDQPSSSSTKKRKTEKKRRWICPFDLAYHEISDNAHFGHCSPGNMIHKYLWRDHLITHHSPKAKAKDGEAELNGRFYMDQDTLDAALEAIKKYEGKPRGVEGVRKCLELFLKVWYLIFPKERFPQFKEPLSAFHPEDGEMVLFKTHLADQARVLIGAIHDVQAKQAVNAGTIISTADYRPTAADNDKVLSQAIAIALLKSSDATEATRWLANASPDTIESAARGHRDQSVPRSVTIPLTEEAEVESHGTLTQSTTVANTPQLVPDVHIIPVPIYPNGTHFEILPFSNQVQSGTQMGCLAIPPGFYAIPTGVGTSMDFSIMTPGLDNVLQFPQLTRAAQQPVNREPSAEIGSQGMSPQTFQGEHTTQQDFII